MTTTDITTRFMRGNKTPEVFEEMSCVYGMGELCNHFIDYDQAIFSDGFISAMENDMMPILGSEKQTGRHNHGDKEYHHLISNDVCYVVYFTEK